MKRYWGVTYNADTTETGNPMSRMYVSTVWEGFSAQRCLEKEMVEEWCYEQFGSRVDYVQGVAACPAWNVYESTEKEFDARQGITRWGDDGPAKQVSLGIGGKERTHELVIMVKPKVCKCCGGMV